MITIWYKEILKDEFRFKKIGEKTFGRKKNWQKDFRMASYPKNLVFNVYQPSSCPALGL